MTRIELCPDCDGDGYYSPAAFGREDGCRVNCTRCNDGCAPPVVVWRAVLRAARASRVRAALGRNTYSICPVCQGLARTCRGTEEVVR